MYGRASFSACIVLATASSSPRTLTKTFAVLRSEVVSTLVTVGNEIRGSRSSSLMSVASSRCSSAFTRSTRRYATSARLGLDDERLDDIPDLDVVVPLEHDAALETGRDLADVVLDAPQRRDRALPDRLGAAEEPGLRAASDDPVHDHAAGDRRLVRGEDLADLGVPEDALDHFGLEHPGEGLLHVVEQLVDDLVLAYVDLGLLGRAFRRHVDLVVEADDDRARRRRERHVGLADVADRVVDDDERDLGLRDLEQGALDRLERALDVGLEDELELLRLAFLDLREHLVERRGALTTRGGRALAR